MTATPNTTNCARLNAAALAMGSFLEGAGVGARAITSVLDQLEEDGYSLLRSTRLVKGVVDPAKNVLGKTMRLCACRTRPRS